MAETNQTPAANDDRGRRVHLILERDMAETADRLTYLNRVLNLVKGSMGLDEEPRPGNRIEDAGEDQNAG